MDSNVARISSEGCFEDEEEDNEGESSMATAASILVPCKIVANSIPLPKPI